VVTLPTAKHAVQFSYCRWCTLVPVHAATALWLPAYAAVLFAPSQQLDDAAYGRHSYFKQSQAAFHTKNKATDDNTPAAWLGHVHIAWHHAVPANLDAGPDCLEQLT